MRSFDDARAKETRVGRGAARAEMQDAATLAELDGGTAALAGGDLTQDHVRHLRSRVDKLPPERRAELLSGDSGADLLRIAREHDAPTFGRKVEDIIASSAAKDVQDDHEKRRSRRFLNLRPSADGIHLSGLLDPVAGHALRLALDAASPAPSVEDTRTRDQRNADALTALARHALDDGAFKASAPVRPHIALTIDAETFARAREHLRTGTHTQDALDMAGRDGAADVERPSDRSQRSTAELLGVTPVVRLGDGPVVPPSELARLLCTAEMSRLVLDADSLPVDVGRTQRLYTGHVRRAVVTRDVSCRWDGCAMPARFCEVHHIDWWDDDHGHTSVDRGVLLCDFHHHELHRRDLDIVREPSTDPPDRRRPIPGEVDYEPPRYRTESRTLRRRERAAAAQRRRYESLPRRRGGAPATAGGGEEVSTAGREGPGTAEGGPSAWAC